MISQEYLHARIVIVDDDAICLAAVVRLLTSVGYRDCAGFSDPIRALEELIKNPPDLLLLDWHMEPICGSALLQRLKNALAPEANPMVLVLTGDCERETRCEALAYGVADFLNKPLDSSEILLRIRNLLHLRSVYVELENKVSLRTLELERTVAELKEVEHLLIQQERLRALGTMAAGVAHDFNNSLTVIRGFSGLYSGRDLSSVAADELRSAFDTIDLASEDASETVRRLREFYRPYTAADEDRRLININELIHESVQLSVPKWQVESQGRGISMEVREELGNPPAISGSPAELREVMLNLIFNAVEAMVQGGTLTIRTFSRGSEAIIEVEDTGIGMTEETRLRCLEPFFTTKMETGSGLGLATSYGIVRRHEGIIEVETEINRGTCFRIILPASAPRGADKPTEQKSALRGLRVLVVDDHPRICTLLECYLAEDGHTVETAANGCEALEKFRGSDFDLVITDLVMPKMSGDQLADAINGISPGTPVILFSGLGQPPPRSLHVTVSLDKPATLAQLRDAIRRAMASPPRLVDARAEEKLCV